MLLKWSRPAGPQLTIAFPTTPEIILARKNPDAQVILVMGPPGPAGPSGSTASTIELPVSQAGPQEIILDRPVSSGILFLNGLMQSPAYYTLLGGNLTVPSEMGCQPGDVISFTY